MFPNVTESYPDYYPNNQQGVSNSPMNNHHEGYSSQGNTYMQRGHQTPYSQHQATSVGYQQPHYPVPNQPQARPVISNPIMHSTVQTTPSMQFNRAAARLAPSSGAGPVPASAISGLPPVSSTPGIRLSNSNTGQFHSNYLPTPGLHTSISTPMTRFNGQQVIMSPPTRDSHEYNKTDAVSQGSKLDTAPIGQSTRLSAPYNITPSSSHSLTHNSNRSGNNLTDGGREWNIKVLVRSKDGEKRQVLTLLLQEKLNPADHSREIFIQVTDKQDPMLFYSLCIAEEDFQNVKASQGLLVDFTSFPGMLCQLLDKCEQEGDNPSPAFILIFNMGLDTSSLDFTELNLFKHLCHLSLLISKATDSKLKEYLVSCIQLLKNELGQTSCQLSYAQQQLLEKQEQLEQHLKELEAVRKDEQETTSSLSQKLVNELQQEKESCTAKINEIQARSESERRELESRHARSLDQLENRVASLDVQNRDLLEGKYRNESNIRELRGKLAAKDDEIKRLESEFHSVSRDKGITEVRNREDARRVAELQKQVESMEQDSRERELEVNRMKDKVKQAQNVQTDLMADLKEKASTVSRRETAVRSVTEELLKANEIIGKLQDQLKQEQNKSKLRGRIAAEQEKLLSDKDKDLQGVQENLRKAEESKYEISKNKEKESTRVKELEIEKEELEKLNKSNENVINWLNKQLADFKTAEASLGTVKGSIGARGKAKINPARKSTSNDNKDSSKENAPLVGLDPKYFQVSTPGGTVLRNEIPDVRQLPTNVNRPPGGLLRR